ncbi:MAG: glycosyltransferase [Candidatus Symbiothrix sp.]|jgi:glycosyltransferase involved in cell wall biosynthesis|nr:glycosyltransferase [Candidatus Symbiothrix sp.]
MILLQINVVNNIYSTGRFVEEIGQLALSNGWTSYIAYGQAANPSQSQLIKIGSKWDIYKHGFLTRLTDRHGFGSKRATKKFIQQIETIKPDIIHLHNIHGYYLNIEILFDYLAHSDIPVVWSLYDCWPITGHCAYFDLVGCNQWQTTCIHCPQKKAYPAGFISQAKKNFEQKKELFNQVKNLTLVPGSHWLETIFGQSYLNKYPSHIIYSGINIHDFSPQTNVSEIRKNMGLTGKFVLLGAASTWDIRKGLNDFIALSQLLSSEYQIVLVGLSSSQINDLPSTIIGVERTQSIQKLAELYSLSDVFVNPTHEDTYPTTNLEAMACGTPVITYQTGGSGESVSEKTGIIVEKGNLPALHQAIQTVKSNGKALYTKACRERALTHFDKEKCYQKYIDLYNTLI